MEGHSHLLFVHSLDLHPSIEVEYLNLLLLFAPSIVIQLDYGFDPMMLMSSDVRKNLEVYKMPKSYDFGELVTTSSWERRSL